MSTSVPLRTRLYYAYRRGFWQYLRGLWLRPRLGSCGGRFFLGARTNIMFPRGLRVGRDVLIGDDVYLNAHGGGVVLGTGVRLRERGWVQVSSKLDNPGVGLVIGEATYIGPNSYLGAGGGITIGSRCAFGGYVQLLAEDHAFDDAERPIAEQGVVRRGITVGDDCWLGNGVIVLDGVAIGDGCVIGAGSVVTRSLPPRSVAVGNPARVLRTRGDGEARP